MNEAIEAVDIVAREWRSASIAKLTEAMALAQGQIEGASKGKVNPHFKNSYADLASVWDACREQLSRNGLAVYQTTSGDGAKVTVETILAHKSGEWISGRLTMTAQQNTPQAIGSCITYARRYALAAMVGVAPEDDDGNAASQTPTNRPQAVAKAPEGFDDFLLDLEAVAANGSDALKAAWTKSQPYMRKHLTDTAPEKWEALKKKAAAVKVPVSA